jgi:hypothetical protein
LTFARCFTNIETTESYQHIFHEIIKTVEHDTKEKFKFLHIDHEGLGCIMADSHLGQANGKNFKL